LKVSKNCVGISKTGVTFPDGIAEAHEYVESGQKIGSVAITVNQSDLA
jgi:hypothetical protein